jgi:hypothetical protein
MNPKTVSRVAGFCGFTNALSLDMNLAYLFDPLPEELVPAGAPATVLCR